MRFRVTRTSAWGFVEFESLDGLMAFGKKYGDLVLTTDDDGSPIVEIYDGYRE